MPGPVGVRWRLLAAFLGISAFAVLAAAASMWAFLELGRVVERTTEESAPAALALLELSRQAERIATAASALLAPPNEAGRAKVAADIRTQLASVEAILAKLRGTSAPAVFGPIETAVAALGSNLNALDKLVAERLATAQTKAKLLSRLSTTVVGTHRLVAPGVLALTSKSRHGATRELKVLLRTSPARLLVSFRCKRRSSRSRQPMTAFLRPLMPPL